MTAQLTQRSQGAESAPKTVTTAAGTALAYEPYGDTEGEPLVFFHGMPGSRLLGELLADYARRQGVRVIAPDRPGCGRSEFPDGFELTDLPSVLTPLADAVGAEQVAVAGFSGGAPYALAAAATVPQSVTSVDIVSGAAPSEFVDERAGIHRALGALAGRTPRLLGACFRGQAALVRHRSADALVDTYTADESPVDVSDEVATIVKDDFQECFATTTAGAVFDSRLIADSWSVSITQVDHPVRLWYGTADGLTDIDSARAMEEQLPNASLTEFDAHGHLGTLLAARKEVLTQVGE